MILIIIAEIVAADFLPFILFVVIIQNKTFMECFRLLLLLLLLLLSTIAEKSFMILGI